MRAIAFAISVACLLAVSLVGGAARADRPPNFVFVLADDLGYGDLGCFGQRVLETPHIDRLAAEGVRLTQHYAGSTVCAPSRCALMTGRHTGHTSVRGNREVQPEGQAPMTEDGSTLPQRLAAAGYACGAFGKWGLGHPGSGAEPLDRGFDRFFGYNCQRVAHRYFGVTELWDDRSRAAIEPSAYTHDLIFDQALEFIREHRDRPFFCFLPVAIPHAAMEAPEEAMRPFRERFVEFDDEVGRYAGSEVANPVAAFAAMMARLDRDCGRLADLLTELGLERDTVLVFTSDNGPHQEGGHRPDFFDSNGPFRGHKRDLYEGGIRVPTLVWAPGRAPAGQSSRVVSAGWDWLPTFCAFAGVASPEGVDGLSLVPAITGVGTQPTHDHLYWEFHEQGGKQAVRRGDWKAVRLGVKADADATPELYDLANDPGETENLAAERPEVVAELTALLDAARTPNERFNFGR